MVDPQPITYTPITYAPQFQAPDWHDNVDLVSAGALNGFNAQFRSLQAELNVLKGVVQQVNTAIDTINQALSSIGASIISANNIVDAANTTVNTANATVNMANNTIGTPKDTAGTATAYGTINEANQIIKNWPTPAWLTVTVNHRGDYTARCLVSYDDLLGQHQSVPSGNLYQGATWSAKVPGGAKNVHIHCEEDTDLVDQPVKTILEQDLPIPLPQPGTKTINIGGTTISPSSW